MSAAAPKYATELWRKAEEGFTDAARTLERGDLKDAAKKATEAETIYRTAELKSIKANYLDETYVLLKDAERKKIAEYAPKPSTGKRSCARS